MSTVAIAGASGVVGSLVLAQLLEREDVASVIAIGRKAPVCTHHKLTPKVVELGNRVALVDAIPKGIKVAICCLGTTMKRAGSKDAFRAVDHDAVVNFAQAAHAQGAQRFVVVSALGADPGVRSFYLRTKGEAESTLERIGFTQLTILRPSLIDDEGLRHDFRIGERLALPLARSVFAFVGRTHRYAPIKASAIANAIVRLAFDETKERVRRIESDALHETSVPVIPSAP